MTRVFKQNPLRQCVLACLRLTVPRRYLLVRGSSRRPVVYLTFDDGPDPETTPQILDVLQRTEARATFFVIGERAAQAPALLRRIAAEGHALGGHTFFHRDPRQVSAAQLREELRQTDEVLQATLGRTTRLFRPPFGKLTLGKLWGLWSAGHTIALWNRDPRDFACDSAEQVLGWFQTEALNAGDIVLLHDTARSTAAALEQILPLVRQAGWEFGTLDDTARG